MSNTRRAAIAAPTITTTGRRKAPKAPFVVDDVRYHLFQPKSSTLARAAAMFENGTPNQVAAFTMEFLSYVEKTPPDKDGNPTGQEHLFARLADPHDDLDVDDLIPLFDKLMQGWYSDRPTGPRPASGGARATSGSAASRGSTRSTRG